MTGNGTAQQPQHTNPEVRATGEACKFTILVVDDELAVRDMVGRILRSRGYTVFEAADGVEALELAGQHPGPIHLLLTDWCMPRLNGGGLIRRLSDGRPETAVLVMSGYMNHETPRDITILSKPFNPQKLVDSVNAALHGQ